jgi:hypothetical protein
MLLLAALCSLAAIRPALATENREGIMVGRVSHVEGKLLRFIEKEKDWVVTVKDSPFGLEDALHTEEDSRVEFTMPNKTWLRIGENTQVQLIDLHSDATTLDIGSGLARLYNRSANAIIKATTPFGYVVASGDTVFDLYVGDESLEVTAVRGKVAFVHEWTKARYEIRSGSFSIIADQSETSKGDGTIDAAWDDWNGERDMVWNKRWRSKSYSAAHLPEPLHDEAYVLDETGRWEQVYYEGEYRYMWRPLRVERSWRPFTEGRWVVYYGDNCWIPTEPFGYITHHYGSWIYVETRRSWYWVPPVMRIQAKTPRFYLSFGWYPGRVSWIHRDAYIGWVPLAPWETYYCYRPWGYHRTVIVNPTVSVSVGINVNLANFFFINHAVVVHHDNFFSGIRYTPHIERVERNVIINNYNPVKVINNTVINNYSENTRRFAVNEVKPIRKPHFSTVERIMGNQKMKSEFGSIGKERIMSDLTRVSALAEPSAAKGTRHLSVSSKLVAPDKANKPLESLSLDRKNLKGPERPVADSKVERRGRVEGEAGKKEPRSPREGKAAGSDKTALQQDGKHVDKQRQSLGWDGEEKQGRGQETAKQGGGGGKLATDQAVKPSKNDRQEVAQREQKSSGGQGRKLQEDMAVDRGGGKKDNRQEIRQAEEPKESGKRTKQDASFQQEQFQKAERKGGSPKDQHMQNYQPEQPQKQKGGGKQSRQEGDMIPQENGKKGGGKKD